MPDTVERKGYLERIKRYAESSVVGNQAFLGVKGVGKTTLFQTYFTKQKRSELAANYKKLFVFSQLDSRKQGSDLYRYLLDQVKMGIMGIPDKEVKNEIKNQIEEIDAVFETQDGRLTQYLTLIRESGYDLILIMDQFHCMARDTEIGKEQYDVLRSFNEQKLITYWIITDTDLMETCASKQYVASFFAQKFTSKLTIKSLDDEERIGVISSFIQQKKVEITEEEVFYISELSGGIPELISMLLDIICTLRDEKSISSIEDLLEAVSAHSACTSLFKGWTSGLTVDQKKILFDVASAESGLSKDFLPFAESKMAELSDDVGRGLLHVEKNNDTKIWSINTVLFKTYIISQGEMFYQDDTENVTVANSILTKPHITNVFNITGNYIHNQTNNVLSIENAVAGLEDLHRLIYGNQALINESQAMGKLDYLPFRQAVWTEMDADEQEEELEKYADGVFSSDIFSRDILTVEQMNEFCLTESLLDDLSDSCRTQVICGVQVYNLIQLCIDNFGLSMSESESPRGILFARAFERHLKDFMAPAYCRIPELASQKVYPTTKRFMDYPLDKTTIGTYSSILNYGYPILAKVSVQLLGRPDRDVRWWKLLVDRLKKIGDLRNECCHSGTTFDSMKLNDLIERVFMQKSLEDILIFSDIPKLRNNQFLKSNVAIQDPIASLIGQKAQFKIISKGNVGNYKGIVNGKYEGSLPKRYAMSMEYISVKEKTIQVNIDGIQDNKYVLSL